MHTRLLCTFVWNCVDVVYNKRRSEAINEVVTGCPPTCWSKSFGRCHRYGPRNLDYIFQCLSPAACLFDIVSIRAWPRDLAGCERLRTVRYRAAHLGCVAVSDAAWRHVPSHVTLHVTAVSSHRESRPADETTRRRCRHYVDRFQRLPLLVYSAKLSLPSCVDMLVGEKS